MLRSRALQLKDGTLKSRGDALLPLMLASYVFESLVVAPAAATAAAGAATAASSPPAAATAEEPFKMRTHGSNAGQILEDEVVRGFLPFWCRLLD